MAPPAGSCSTCPGARTVALERLEDDLDTLLEHLAVGVLVEERRTEDFGLTGVVVAPDAEETRPPVMMSVIA